MESREFISRVWGWIQPSLSVLLAQRPARAKRRFCFASGGIHFLSKANNFKQTLAWAYFLALLVVHSLTSCDTHFAKIRPPSAVNWKHLFDSLFNKFTLSRCITVIKHDGHLRTRRGNVENKSRRWVYFTFLECSEMSSVLLQSNTRFGILHLLYNIDFCPQNNKTRFFYVFYPDRT